MVFRPAKNLPGMVWTRPKQQHAFPSCLEYKFQLVLNNWKLTKSFHRVFLKQIALAPSTLWLMKWYECQIESLNVKYTLWTITPLVIINLTINFVYSFYSRCDSSMDQICQKKAVTWWEYLLFSWPSCYALHQKTSD